MSPMVPVQTPSRRIAYVVMTYDVILAVAASRPYPVTSTLPADAKVSHIVLLDTSAQARVYFESEALEPVPEGQEIPEASVILTMHFPDPS